MMTCYLRSSSLGTLEFCEMKYFFVYVLGMKDKQNKKATLGTIVHRVMQVLGDKRIAKRNNKRKVKNDDIPDLTLKQCDDIPYVTRLCFDYYDANEPTVDLDEADYRQCVRWVEKAIAYNNGDLDPRNQNIHETELFFDIEIKKEWSKFEYVLNGEKISGNLSIKGTVDVIIKEDDVFFRVLDYKTGKRLNWATGKEKTYNCLMKDTQLLLYYYALKNLYPDKSFYISIYYINDGGVFDMVFDEKDYIKAENILRQKFEYIRSVQLPQQLSSEQAHWKCQRLCEFSKIDEETGKSVCNKFHDMIKQKGIDWVTDKYANSHKIQNYGDGGGRIAEKG